MTAPIAVYDEDLQGLIIARVGDTPPGAMANAMPTIWQLYAYLPLSYPGGIGQQLQALYAQRDCLEIALAAVRTLVDIRSPNQEEKDSQQGVRLSAMFAATTAEIVRVELVLRQSRGTQVGQLTQVVPEPNPFGPGTISADDTAFRGDPYTPFPGGVFGPPVISQG